MSQTTVLALEIQLCPKLIETSYLYNLKTKMTLNRASYKNYLTEFN